MILERESIARATVMPTAQCSSVETCFLYSRSKRLSSAGHTRKEGSARSTFEAVAAQEFGMLGFGIKIAEARDENTSGLAVFVDGIASGEHGEKARCADASEVVHQVMAEHSRTVSQALRMMLRFGIEENARRSKVRQPHESWHQLRTFARDPLNKSTSLALQFLP